MHPTLLGLLSLDHKGGAKQDGLCISILVSTLPHTENGSEEPSQSPIKQDEYEWKDYKNGDLKSILDDRVDPEKNISVLLLR